MRTYLVFAGNEFIAVKTTNQVEAYKIVKSVYPNATKRIIKSICDIDYTSCKRV
jgi:hypothetical protein